MTEVEIVVFQDKSWVRFIEYQKLKEELKQEKQSLAKRIYELQSDLTREKVLHEQLKEHCDELELINQKVMEENEQLKQENKRAKVLLEATLDLLQKQKDSCYVLNLLEETSFYDKADCDGYCLFGDIENFLNFGS